MAERRRVTANTSGVSRVKQSFAGDSDVNAIMRKYSNTGMLSYQNRTEPRYGDFSSGEDYFSAMVKVTEAQRLFMELPANVRQYFRNDPAELLNCVFDPARKEEAARLGLVSEAKVQEPEPAPAPVPPA